MASWREFLSVAGVAATVVAIGAVISIIDPMGLNDAADRHSADVVARVTAPFYGGARTEGRDLTTVVEVSDETLRELDRSWPPEHDFYADILDTLVPDRPGGPKPAAILLDYILASDLRDPEGHDLFVKALRRVTKADAWETDPACRATPMAKIACIVKRGGVPVILGKPYPPARRGLAAGLLTAAILVSPAAAGEAVSLPGPRVTLYKDADCFARGADVPVTQLGAVTRESPADAACVKLKAADGKSYFVLPSAIKPPTGCAPRRAAPGPRAKTFGSQGASSCARD